jgi:penicillin-binding protein 2
MVPRRNPEIVICVLQEHGDWGANSAKIAAQIVTTYVNKQRTKDKNVLDQAAVSKPVEVGAVWSEPPPTRRKHSGAPSQDVVLHAGHYTIYPAAYVTPPAVGLLPMPAWLLSSPLRFRPRQP